MRVGTVKNPSTRRTRGDREKRLPRLRRRACAVPNRRETVRLRDGRRASAVRRTGAPHWDSRSPSRERGCGSADQLATAMVCCCERRVQRRRSQSRCQRTICVRLHDHQRLAPVLPTSREDHPKGGRARRRHPSSVEGRQLLPKRQVFPSSSWWPRSANGVRGRPRSAVPACGGCCCAKLNSDAFWRWPCPLVIKSCSRWS